MGQPNPPGDMPLFEGLGTEWNDIVGAFPEDKRAEFAPKLKERLSAYEPLRQWEDMQKSGITPDFADTAIRVYAALENNPREVYEAIGRSLGISTKEAKEVVEEIKQGNPDDDPRIAEMQKRIDTMSQIMLAQREQESSSKQQADADAQLEKDMNALKQKYGNDPNFDEEEILMRMMHKGLSPEEAYTEFSGRVSAIQKRRPAPYVLGAGGHVPSNSIDVKKLDNAGTKNLVAQMLEHAKNTGN